MTVVLIKDLPVNERPRERLSNYGVSKLSNEELISIILKTGNKNNSVKDLSNKILSMYKSISDFKYLEVNTLTKINGVGKVKAIELIAAIELGRRVYSSKEIIDIKINSSKDIYEYFRLEVADYKQEYFYAVYLDNKKKVIDKRLLFIGTINSSIAHPREIFKNAYLLSSSYIICVHNHPSGDSTPSKEDEEFTKAIMQIGNLQGIPILDHIIIGKDEYYSFFEGDKLSG